MRHKAFLLLAVLALPGCESHSTENLGVSPLAPPVRPMALLTVTKTGAAQVCPSPSKIYRIGVPLRIAETGGVGVFWHNVDMRLFTEDETIIEANEIGADRITQVLGSNHLAAGSTTDFVALFDFNNLMSFGKTMNLNFTDDSGTPSGYSLEVGPVVEKRTCSF